MENLDITIFILKTREISTEKACPGSPERVEKQSKNKGKGLRGTYGSPYLIVY